MRLGWARCGRMESCMITSTFLQRLSGSWAEAVGQGAACPLPLENSMGWGPRCGVPTTPTHPYLVFEEAEPHQLEGLLVLLQGWG